MAAAAAAAPPLRHGDLHGTIEIPCRSAPCPLRLDMIYSLSFILPVCGSPNDPSSPLPFAYTAGMNSSSAMCLVGLSCSISAPMTLCPVDELLFMFSLLLAFLMHLLKTSLLQACLVLFGLSLHSAAAVLNSRSMHILVVE